MDFGRITLAEDLVLYLFGTPGSAPVLVHVGRPGARCDRGDHPGRRPQAGRTASPPSTSSRRADLPFLIAVNEFDDGARYPADDVRKALALRDHIPVVNVDARDRQSARAALIAITEYALSNLSSLPG